MTLNEIFKMIAEITGGRAPRVRIPHDLIMPVAFLAETWARLTGGGDPFVTMDGLRMAKKKMFYSPAKAKRKLGYAPRPAQHALRDAIHWFKENGYIS